MPDRLDLLAPHARRRADSCPAFIHGKPGNGSCASDGHYLCDECARLCHSQFHRRGLCGQSELLCDQCARETESTHNDSDTCRHYRHQRRFY